MADLFDTLQKETEQETSRLKLPPKFVPTTYHDVVFEERCDRIHQPYENSLSSLKKRSYDRHPRPAEIFTLLADSLEGKVSLGLETVAKNINEGWWEWLSLAWERKGNLLIAYLDPEGLVYDNKKGIYIKQDFHCTSKHFFDVGDKKSQKRVPLREFSDYFIEFHYGRKYDELPPQIKKEAYVWLPPDGVLWPVGRGGNEDGYDLVSKQYGTSYGVWSCRWDKNRWWRWHIRKKRYVSSFYELLQIKGPFPYCI